VIESRMRRRSASQYEFQINVEIVQRQLMLNPTDFESNVPLKSEEKDLGARLGCAHSGYAKPPQ
jgi:hypothetical protein